MKFKNKIVEETLKVQSPAAHHKVPRIWIVVADQRIARIFRKNGDGLELIGEALPTKTERKKGMPDNSMGRVISLGGSPRHKLTPHLEPGRHDAQIFAHDLSVWLENAVRNDLFDRLVLVAAPKTLGDLRQRLSKSVQSRVTAEVNKELTKFSEKALQEELKEIVWF